jgi:hypothetical protein
MTSMNDWEASLGPSITSEIREEIHHVISSLPAATGCVLTGSLVEGLGNKHSDIDLYVIREDERAGARPTAIGLRTSRYVDCEFMSVQSVQSLASKIRRANWKTIRAVPIREIDRYYRLAIGLAVVVTIPTAAVLDECKTTLACRALNMRAAAQAHDYLWRAHLMYRLHDERTARVVLREALRWATVSELALAGEGYASLKWTLEKAIRVWGPHSAESKLSTAYFQPIENFEVTAMALENWLSPESGSEIKLAPRIMDPTYTVIAEDDVLYLVRNSKSVVEIRGFAAVLYGHLVRDISWRKTAELLAAEASMPVSGFEAACFPELQQLHAAGLVDLSSATNE